MRFSNRFLQIAFVALLCLVVGGAVTTLQADKQPKMSRVYMFGFAGSFTDSLACLTEISKVDTAWFNDRKMLIDRALYSQQLQFFMEANGTNHAICSVIFDTSAKSLKKSWNKVKKRYQKAQGLTFKIIPLSDFQFKPEEYRAIYMDEIPEPEKKGKDGKESKESKESKKSKEKKSKKK